MNYSYIYEPMYTFIIKIQINFMVSNKKNNVYAAALINKLLYGISIIVKFKTFFC